MRGGRKSFKRGDDMYLCALTACIAIHFNPEAGFCGIVGRNSTAYPSTPETDCIEGRMASPQLSEQVI